MAKKQNPAWKASRQPKPGDSKAILEAVSGSVHKLLNDPKGLHAQLEEGFRQQIRSTLLNEIAAELDKPDPVQAIRSRLIKNVPLRAQFAVIMFTPEAVPCPNVSGALRPHIVEIARNNADVARVFQDMGLNPTVISEALMACAWAAASANVAVQGYDRTRVLLGDSAGEAKDDWLQPFTNSCYLAQEFQYRRQLRLPSNLAAHGSDADGVAGEARSRVHGVWPGILEAGGEDPRAAWSALWQQTFGEPAPY